MSRGTDAGTQTVIQIGRGDFMFCAAHSGLHDGRFESLHGHTFLVTLRMAGQSDPVTGMLTDFDPIRVALRKAIDPLRRRTLIATETDPPTVASSNGRVCLSDGYRSWDLPAEDVALLPIANTTLEELARYLLDQLLPQLWQAGLVWAELCIAEAPDVSVAVRRDLR